MCRWNPGQTGEAEVDARQGFLDHFCRGPTNRCLGLEWTSARESQGALYRGCFGEVDGTEVRVGWGVSGHSVQEAFWQNS